MIVGTHPANIGLHAKNKAIIRGIGAVSVLCIFSILARNEPRFAADCAYPDRMSRYSVAELHEPSEAILEAGPGSFTVRRILDRLDRREINIQEATVLLRRGKLKTPMLDGRLMLTPSAYDEPRSLLRRSGGTVKQYDRW